MDLTALPLLDGVIDVILCNHVLEHIPDDRRAMAELVRVLKPGGWAVLQVPRSEAAETFEDASITDPDQRAALFGQADHVRMYGRDYPDRLRAAGFIVEEHAFSQGLPLDVVRGCGLSSEAITFCLKPGRRERR
jgi:SAM-dependent methyltransferase